MLVSVPTVTVTLYMTISGSEVAPYKLVTAADKTAGPSATSGIWTMKLIGRSTLETAGPRYSEAKTEPRDSGNPFPEAMPKTADTS